MFSRHTLTLSLGSLGLSLFIDSDAARCRRSWNEGRHCNGDFELHLIPEGTCTVHVDSDVLTLQPGDALLIRPGVYHRPQASGGPLLHLPLSFSVQAGDPAVLAAIQARPYRQFSLDESSLEICRQLLAELETAAPLRKAALSSLFSLLMIHICRLLRWPILPESPAEEVQPDWRSAVIDNFFEDHLTDYGAKALLAEELHLSIRQVDRVLQALYGMSFRQKLLQARMDHAAWLLQTTDHSVSEIQSLTGYASAATFFRAFRDAHGMTPREYRVNTGPGANPEDPSLRSG